MIGAVLLISLVGVWFIFSKYDTAEEREGAIPAEMQGGMGNGQGMRGGPNGGFATGSYMDIAVGETVVVMGTASGDGTFLATLVMIAQGDDMPGRVSRSAEDMPQRPEGTENTTLEAPPARADRPQEDRADEGERLSGVVRTISDTEMVVITTDGTEKTVIFNEKIVIMKPAAETSVDAGEGL